MRLAARALPLSNGDACTVRHLVKRSLQERMLGDEFAQVVERLAGPIQRESSPSHYERTPVLDGRVYRVQVSDQRLQSPELRRHRPGKDGNLGPIGGDRNMQLSGRVTL
jgi:hypothetical protein